MPPCQVVIVLRDIAQATALHRPKRDAPHAPALRPLPLQSGGGLWGCGGEGQCGLRVKPQGEGQRGGAVGQ